jgi:hypothetical protein
MITTTNNKESGVTGTGAAQTIAFTFPVFASTEVKVKKRLTSTGAETDMVVTTDFTVSLTGTGSPNYTGGSITTVTPFIASTYTIHVYRETTQTQSLDLIENDDLPAETVEARFDKLFCLYADLKEQIGRCLKIPITDTALTVELPNSVDRASETLSFDASGNVTTS